MQITGAGEAGRCARPQAGHPEGHAQDEIVRAVPVMGPGDVDELTALIGAGGVWGQGPPWFHRGPCTEPTPNILKAAERGLRRLL
ncbi:hypothetical protein GCM10010245_26230 [Streptomyces spectabilis]|nr:hypothetical protein GCM10010245_26230 [Streptomyces spectabilis]